jgi:hypothetical protein
MPTVPINWLAVIVAAVVAWLIGAIYYSPFVLGRQWVAAHGYTAERLAAMRAGAARAYGISVLCFLAMAFTIAVLVGYINMNHWVQGVKLGLLLWLGLSIPLHLIAHVYSDRRFATFGIDAGYQLLYFVAMGGILAGWR